MTKVSVWLPAAEYEVINSVKGDISTSLWIRRQIRNALSKGEGTNQAPKAATVPNAYTTTPNLPVTNQEVRVS